MDLSQLTDEQLEKELEARKKEKKLRKTPKMVDNPDLTKLKKTLEEYVIEIRDHGRKGKDSEHWIYEAAIEAFYGKEFWPWICEKVR